MIDELRELRKEYHLNQDLANTQQVNEILKTTASEKSSVMNTMRNNAKQRTQKIPIT